MIRQTFLITALLSTLLITSGCLYPASELAQNKIPNEAQISMVQSAVDQFKEENKGILPIKTMPSDTPVFEKYIIDFNTLKNKNFLTELPGNSFERGGHFKYALVNVETDPRVKLIDVKLSQKLQEVYTKLHFYQQKHTYLPLKENIAGKYFELDFEKLGYSEAQYVTSPYSNQDLPIIIDNQGRLYIDYSLDLHREMQEKDFTDYQDIRYILVDHYPFLPAYSPRYSTEDKHPILKVD